MAQKKYLDIDGLSYLWGKITSKFVAKETGKGLSTNDFTTAEKTKLAGIEAGAEVNTIDNISINGTAGTVSNKTASVTVDASDIAFDDSQAQLGQDVQTALEQLDADNTGLNQAISNIRQLPSVTSSDNGKVLRVVNGAWAVVSLPSASGVSF